MPAVRAAWPKRLPNTLLLSANCSEGKESLWYCGLSEFPDIGKLTLGLIRDSIKRTEGPGTAQRGNRRFDTQLRVNLFFPKMYEN